MGRAAAKKFPGGRRRDMKRIIILIDGTWNLEAENANTNVALLDPGNKTVAGNKLILEQGADKIKQVVHYHCGIGANQTGLKHWLGGALGFGLKDLVLEAYESLAGDFESGDDVIVLGFSRGAYAARALAGMIGASGIVKTASPENKEAAWANYRIIPKNGFRADASGSTAVKTMSDMKTRGEVHSANRVKCVGVWETVGSYGVPAGFGGLSQLGRYFAQATLGFHDTSFGDHVDIGLHALGVDERRRPFVPTFWTIAKGQKPRGHVEQTWFAGDHGGVGGGHPDTGLSNEALIWMIARLQALAGVEFDPVALQALGRRANAGGEVYDSTAGWLLDHNFPHLRIVLPPDAIDHGPLFSTENPDEEHINERMHWSLLKKHGHACTVFGIANTLYAPLNWPPAIPPDKIAEITPEESAIYGR